MDLGVDIVLKFGLDLTQFLKKQFRRWELSITSKYIFISYLIRRRTLNQNFEQNVEKILIWVCLIGQIIQLDGCRLKLSLLLKKKKMVACTQAL